MSLIRAKAPLRVSFGGGGTDVTPYPERFGGAALNATIDRYVYVSLYPRDGTLVNVMSRDFDDCAKFDLRDPLAYDGHWDLVKASTNAMHVERGFDAVIHGDAPPGCGLGTSSALVVAMLAALAKWEGVWLPRQHLAQLAYNVERVEVGIAGGRQDQFASAFGGINWMQFEADSTSVHPLDLSRDVVNELQFRLLLCFTGETRRSAGIIADQSRRFVAREPETTEALDETLAVARAMRKAINDGKLDVIGHLMREAWYQKKRFSPLMSDERIDLLFDTAMEHDALGGKLLGAGGGGYLLFYGPEYGNHDLARALTKAGGQVSTFAFEPHGVQAWRVD